MQKVMKIKETNENIGIDWIFEFFHCYYSLEYNQPIKSKVQVLITSISNSI